MYDRLKGGFILYISSLYWTVLLVIVTVVVIMKLIPPRHLQKLIPLMYTSCIDWKFSCAIEKTHSMLTLSPDGEYFMAEEAEKADPRVWLSVLNSRVTLPVLMLGLETYCWRVRQGTPENSPGH